MARVAQRLLGDRSQRQSIAHEVEAVEILAIEDSPLLLGRRHDGIDRRATVERAQILEQARRRLAPGVDDGPLAHESAQDRRLAAFEHVAPDALAVLRLELADCGS